MLSPSKLRKLLLLFTDVAIAVAVFLWVFNNLLNISVSVYSLSLWSVVTLIVLTMIFSGTYLRAASERLPKLPLTTFFKAFIALLPCLLVVPFIKQGEITNYLVSLPLVIGIGLFGALATLSRLLFNRIFAWDDQKKHIIYLGYSPDLQGFLKEIERSGSEAKVTVVTNEELDLPNVKTIVTSEGCQSLASLFPSDQIVIDPKFALETDVTEQLVKLRLAGTSVKSLPDFYEDDCFKVSLPQLEEHWFLRTRGFSIIQSAFSLRVKRLLDVVLAGILIVVGMPFMVLAAIIIKLTSDGPICITQNRVGLSGKIFSIIKFRTMYLNAEDNGPQWSAIEDQRVTKIGKFLRAFRIDELPQCWNILLGDMSFIGPRPERPEFTKILSSKISYYDLRHLVKPGLTGWAQVMYGYGASEQDSLRKLEYDLFYIKHQSLLFDVNILVRTVQTVLNRVGR